MNITDHRNSSGRTLRIRKGETFSTIRPSRLVYLDVFLIFLFLGLGITHAQEFEIKGTTVQQIYQNGINVLAAIKSLNPTNTFIVKVQGCKYDISVKSSRGNIYETAYDGTLRHLIADKTPTNVLYNAIIESKEIPADDGTTINYLWLAYASTCYFSKLTTNRLNPIWMLDDPSLRDEGYTIRGAWKLKDSDPHLPKQVLYLNDGTHHVLSPSQGHVTFRYAPPFDLGFTNAEYNVLATTNIDGLVLPIRFTFTRFYIQGRRLLVRTFTEGDATVVRKGSTPTTFRPQFVGRAIALDKRFWNADRPVPTVPYWVTNGNWPDMKSLGGAYREELLKYNAAKRAVAASSKSNNVKQNVLVGILALLAVCSLILIAPTLIKTKN